MIKSMVNRFVLHGMFKALFPHSCYVAATMFGELAEWLKAAVC